MSKKHKLKWKRIAIPESMKTEELIGIEELCDYDVVRKELVTSGSACKKRKVNIEKVKDTEDLCPSQTVNKKISGLWVVSSIEVPKEGNKQIHTHFTKEHVAKRKKIKEAIELRKHPEVFPLKKRLKKHEGKKDVDKVLNFASNVPVGSDDNKGNEHSNSITPVGMEAWSLWRVPESVLKALSDLGFKTPTQIQELTLPPAILGRRDILGAAETGSGKTLAFGIPIIYGILQQKEQNALNEDLHTFSSNDNECSSDEAQIQYINEMCRTNTKESSETPIASEAESIELGNSKKTKNSGKKLYALILTPTRELAIQIHDHLVAVAKYTGLRVAVVVGGLASQKQERLLKKRPEIVVATPGRLWEMIENGNPHLQDVGDISFLAIDETDRMLEKGHFQELQTLLERINCDELKKQKRQNFVFSATLTMVHEPPKYVNKYKNPKQITPGQKLQQIISSLGITNPKVVDITLERGTASTLSEARIVCPLTEKDYYLYYFILRHSGRTLVFCNSITCVRRLTQILGVLQCKPQQLHANMQQRQRLKNLERFRDDPSGLLLATDVAARGLDIPNVQHVIHYQVPRTAENYVHRSGRTARAQKEGITVLFMEPDEVPTYLRLCQSLGRDRDIPDFPVENDIFSAAKTRVTLALQIDKLEHSLRRINSKHGWFQKAAKEMDMLLDEDDIPNKMNDEQLSRVRRQINGLRKELNDLIGKPVIPKSLSVKFPNQNVRKTDQLSAVEIVKDRRKQLGAFVKIRK